MTAEMYDQAAPRELSGKRRGLVKNGHTAPPKLVASHRFEPRNERNDRRGQILETADDVAQPVWRAPRANSKRFRPHPRASAGRLPR